MKKVGILIFLILLLSACSDSNSNHDKEITSPTDGEKTEQKVLNYKEYQSIVQNFANKVEINGYNYKDGSDGIDAIRIDENLSFGKRKWLTKDGDVKTPLEPTQELFFYENDDGNRLLTITLAYTENFIGNDMLFYNISSGYDINDELSNNEIIALSYKNIVISIIQTTTNEIEMEDTQNAAASIIGYIDEY